MSRPKDPGHQAAAAGDIVVGEVLGQKDAWLAAKVAGVDSDGIVATIDLLDDQGDMAVHRVFVARHGGAVGWKVVRAAELTAKGREELPGLIGDLESLKAEFRKFKAETIQ